MSRVNNDYKMDKHNKDFLSEAEKIQTNFSTLLNQERFDDVVNLIKGRKKEFTFRIIPIIDQQKKSS